MAATTITTASLGEVSASDARLGFGAGFVLELIDLRQPQPLAVFVFVLAPQSYELSEQHESTLTPTQGNVVVDESVGVQQRSIMLEGTFGRKERAASAYVASQGGGKPLSGDDHHFALRDLLRRYSALKQSDLTAPHTRLVFHALREDDHFVIAKPLFVTPRNARETRMHYKYRFTATAIGDAREITRLRRNAAANDGSRFDDALRSISQSFHDARAAFADLTQSIDSVKRKVGNITTVLTQAAQLINAVGAAIGAGQSLLIDYPIQQVATVVESLAFASDDLLDSIDPSPETQNAARQLRRMEAAFDVITMFPSRFKAQRPTQVWTAYQGERRLSPDDIRNGTAGAAPGSATRVARGTAQEAGFPVTEYRGVREITVRAGDTLEGIAVRAGVPPELIVEVNDLRPPYLLPGGGPGVLGPGDIVLVPEILGGSGDVSPTQVSSAGDAIYGVDLALDLRLLEREGVLDIADPIDEDAGDAPLRGGVDNVAQGISVTIATERGSTVYVPDVGINRNVGRKGTLGHVLLASTNLRDAVLADDRIESIRRSAVVLDGDVLTQEIDPVIAGSAADTTLVLPLGTTRG